MFDQCTINLCFIKETIHPKNENLSSHVIPDLYDSLSSVEHKGRYFKLSKSKYFMFD